MSLQTASVDALFPGRRPANGLRDAAFYNVFNPGTPTTA
jgi:hypothetical protein